MDIWQILQTQFENNELFAGGAILMAAGTLLALMRKWPEAVYKWIKRQCLVEVDIPDREAAFNWMNNWLAQDKYSKKRARLLTVHTKRDDEDRDDPRPKIIFSPAPGTHYLWYQRRFMVLTRHRENPNQGGNSGGSSSRDPFREYFTIKILGRDRSVAHKLIEEAREVVLPKEEYKVQLHQCARGYWNPAGLQTARSLDSIVLPEGITQNVVQDIDGFLKARHWYANRGIPYRRGYMLHGPPGNGKSSFVMGLASHFKFDVCVINLRAKDFDDTDLFIGFAEVPKHSIMLIEDIDCVVDDRKIEDASVTFSGLLNALDGVASAEGQIVFMTTNHLEKLDPALIRPGRCDMKIEFQNADPYQIETLFNRFYDDRDMSEAFATACPNNVSMAQLQGHFLKFRNDPQQALMNAHLVKEN